MSYWSSKRRHRLCPGFRFRVPGVSEESPRWQGDRFHHHSFDSRRSRCKSCTECGKACLKLRIKSGGDREFANVLMAPAGPGQPPQDVAALIASSGWAKVRDPVGEGDEAVRRLGAEEAKRRETLRNAESQAKAEGKGVWSEEAENVSRVRNRFLTISNAWCLSRCLRTLTLSLPRTRTETSTVSLS